MKKFLSILLSALVTVSLAAMVNAEDPAECPVLDTPNMELTANSGAGYATLEEAAASIGKTPLLVPTYVVGSNGNNNEGPDKLWDNDTATKFCTGEFPTQSIAKFANPVTVDGIIMATANDNSQYNNRSPFEWTVYVSSDGENWTPIAYGDDTFFEEADLTYYAAAVTPVENVSYVYFTSEGGLSGCFQMSELVLTGSGLDAAAAEATEETVAETEAAAEETVAETEATVEETEAETVAETEAAAEETVAETEATVEETEAETVAETEAAAEETVEAPAADASAETAPQTFDMGIIAAAAAVVSLAGYAVAKKH